MARWPEATFRTLNRLEEVERELNDHYVGRSQAIRVLLLGALCQEHVLLLGPPGTAKTDLVSRFARQFNATQFSYLLTRFTEPSEIFGPLDFEAFRERRYRVVTDGMLPTVQIAFLDEVFQGSSAILNTLLTLVNERRFHNGPTIERVPLITLVGASNEIPSDPALAAFADRFLLRALVEPVARTHLAGLMQVTTHELSTPPEDEIAPIIGVEQVEDLHKRLREVRVRAVMPVYQDVVAELLAYGVTLSDRRIVRGLKLVAAAALLRRDDTARPRDLWPLLHFWTDPKDLEPIEQIVQRRVEEDGGEPLSRVRTTAEILLEAEGIAGQLLDQTGPTRPSIYAYTAGLSRLNLLRRELIEDHGDADEPRRRVDELIGLVTGPLTEYG